MGTCVIKFVLVVFCLCDTALAKAIHTSDKLDFGDTPYRSSLVKSDKKLPVKVTRTVDTITSPSERISVSCGPTGCNTTNNNNSIEAEVVVHVKTNVNFDRSQDRKEVEDVSDVPIVVGYRGSSHDDTPNEDQFRSYPSVSPDRDEASSRSDTPFRHSYGDSPVSIGGGYGRQDFASENSYQGSLNHRPQTNRYSGSSFSSTPSPLGYYGPTSTSRVPNNYYDSSTSRPLDTIGNSSPLSVTISGSNRRNFDYNSYRDNNVELQIPYFEHTYNNHYFGEEPPPHTVSFPKTNSLNPVEFRSIPRNNWRPSFWNGRPNKYAFSNDGSNFINAYTHNHNPPISPYSQTVHQRGHSDTGCLCREQRTDDAGSNPYAASSVNHHTIVRSKDPGASIDDKLAPLN